MPLRADALRAPLIGFTFVVPACSELPRERLAVVEGDEHVADGLRQAPPGSVKAGPSSKPNFENASVISRQMVRRDIGFSFTLRDRMSPVGGPGPARTAGPG